MFLPKGNKTYPVPGRIKSIIFGVKTSDMDIEIIKKLINGKNLNLYKAVLKKREFGIKLEKIYP